MTQPHSKLWIPATDFGLAESLPGCEGFNLTGLTTYERARIPELNPHHAFNEALFSTMALWWRIGEGEPLFLSGPAGSGKTSTALQWCARLHVPVVSVMARARMDRRELLGQWQLVNGSTEWIDGPASLAWRHGWVLLVNEFSAAPADLWVSCNDLLEGATLDIEATGERIVRHPDARIICTDNTRGQAEIEEGLFGRHLQDKTVTDRVWHCRLEGLRRDEEVRVLLAELPPLLRDAFDAEALTQYVERVVKAAEETRLQSSKQTLGFETRDLTVGHRRIKRFLRLMLEVIATGDTKRLTREVILAVSVTEALDAAEREAIATIFFTILGESEKALAKACNGKRYRQALALAQAKACQSTNGLSDAVLAEAKLRYENPEPTTQPLARTGVEGKPTRQRGRPRTRTPREATGTCSPRHSGIDPSLFDE